MHRFTVLAALSSISAFAVVGCNSKPAEPPPPAVQLLNESSTAVRLQATIYELRVPAERIGELDSAKLAKADFSHPLPDFGEARALYRVDQKVSLAGDRVIVGTDEPMVTSSRVTDRGQKVNTVQYNSVGAIVVFKGERMSPRQLEVTSTVEMSTRTESAVQISEGVTSSVIRRTNMSLKGPVELGKPSVLISADASSRDKDGKAIVYVARLVLGAGE